MMESKPPQVLLLSRDEPTLALLSRLAGAGGAAICRADTVPVPAGSWSLVCVDEALGAPLEELGAGAAPVLWLSPRPRGAVATRALQDGAADVLGLPLWEPEARARLARWLPDEARLTGAEAAALQRDRLYAALSVSKADWEQTFDTIPDSIAIIGSDRIVLRVNRALAESVGSSPREMVGQSCHQGLHGCDTPCDQCVVEEVFQGGAAVRWPREVRRNGRVYDYQAFPLLDEQGGVRAVITYGRDVTREEQLEQGLRHSEKLVTLGQLAAGIAHEINNPLTAISSYAQLLGLQAEGTQGAESARRIQNGIERIHRLVQNLMSFVRPDEDAFYPLDLNEIVARTLSFSRYEVTRGDTLLEQDLQPGLPKVLGSEAQLEQLFVNLLTNARDAVGGRGTVQVATGVDGDRVQLTVRDDGVGLDPETVDQLFEPFYTTKPEGKGTGLGLFIAAGIAEKHRGSLRLYSRPGRGTEARLILPSFR
ncbi:MAG: ATP-binding protein [Deferrisomatales bacterium]|nr:ATP-binding protein [Deferrisomatales bacterium]